MGAPEIVASKDPEAFQQRVIGLGKLTSSFHGLEFMLRAFLYKHQTPKAQRFPWGQDFYAHPLDAVVPLNAITNFSTLGELIKRYNLFIATAHQDALRIDARVVAVRNALAHGRVSAPGESETVELITFSRPSKNEPNRVRVSFRAQLTSEW